MENDERECEFCNGTGRYVGHEEECWETGECRCSGVTMECEGCYGKGVVAGASKEYRG